MPSKRKGITKRARQLLDNFEESAKVWGWQQDQGVGFEVDRAEHSYFEDRDALVKYIRRLTNENRRLKEQYGPRGFFS